MAPAGAAKAEGDEESALPFRIAPGGLKVLLRLQPGAARNALEGVAPLADGRSAFRARVTAPPEGGKANAAAVKLLAKTWGLPKTSMSIIAGQTDRTKTLLLEGDGEDLKARLEAWMKTRGE